MSFFNLVCMIIFKMCNLKIALYDQCIFPKIYFCDIFFLNRPFIQLLLSEYFPVFNNST